MISISKTGAYLINGREIIEDGEQALAALASKGFKTSKDEAKKGTMAWSILSAHNVGRSEDELNIRFDALASHDITYVGIIQTARASGMSEFPVPYVLTNCHNTLCAVGGTINEDDHAFALSAAKKYGGIYVPPHMAVIHSYNREMLAKGGAMILASDSHTRYGALGTMGIGEGGGELAKQLSKRTYDLSRPEVVGVYLEGEPIKGVGAMDVALSIVGAVYKSGLVKNKVMKFVGPGIKNLPVEYRNGIDVMTTETTCLSSIWETDEAVREYYAAHGREGAYKKLAPAGVTYYDGMIRLDLSKVRPSIAMPFHPSNVYTIEELIKNPADILAKVEKDCLEQLDNKSIEMGLLSKIRDGAVWADQGVIAGCAGGTFDNVCDAADIMRGNPVGSDGFRLSVYPGSQPAYMELVKNGSVADLMAAGAIVRSAFCGPCFGAGDTPANGELSIRHTTRNFPNREGSKPGEGQIASVALMDAHSIAATAANVGRLTSATEIDVDYRHPKYFFDSKIYQNAVYDGTDWPDPSVELKLGPNIKDWPAQPALCEDILIRVVSYITDEVTTTDELIPSGETSSFRSNPLRLAEFTLSRKDPGYVGRAKEVLALETGREESGSAPAALKAVYESLAKSFPNINPDAVEIGSAVFANKPGDGSAREQAASCQRVLGGLANLAMEYATKRYRSNCINWGMVPFVCRQSADFKVGDYIYIPGIRSKILEADDEIMGYVVDPDKLGAEPKALPLAVGELTKDERQIIADGCLINFYRN